MEEIRWLKSAFRETHDSGSPQAKRMKFSDVSDELHQQFPHQKFTNPEMAQLIHEAFPNTDSKRCGKARQTFILGLERQRIPELVAGTSEPSTITTEMTSSTAQTVIDLQAQIEELKKRVAELEQMRKMQEDVFCHQADELIQHKTEITLGPSSLEGFHSLTFDSIVTELQTRAPDLYHLFLTIGDTKRNQQEDEEVTTEDIKVISSLSSILNARSARAKGLPLLMGMMLVARGTSKQAVTVLSHAGMCMSYTSIWSYLTKLTEDAQYKEVIQHGHWIWVYDNLNLHQAVRHERQDMHSAMLNATARLAVAINNFPNWTVNWDDTAPQKSRNSLTIDDFLPSSADAAALHDMAVQYTMEFLVQEFASLESLKQLVPARKSPYPLKRPNVVPMEILFKDEKYKAETIEIIRQLMDDAKLSGAPEVVVGDQLTCKNIRAMKAWTVTEVERKHRLQWAHEVPGDFHFLWECLRVVFSIFWGTPSDTGSLCNMREYISRNLVSKGVKVFNVGDEFLIHCFKAHFIARICSIFGITSPSDDIQHTKNLEWLKAKAQVIVTETINPIQTSDPVYYKHRTFLHMAFLYIDLRRAIQWEDGPHIIRHWKLWLPRFIATGCKNYSTEAINLIAHIHADFPKHIAYIATHNRTVNTTGKPGRGKPIDQLMEHYVLVVKQALRVSGANRTDKHIIEVSMCALFLLEAAKKCDKLFGVHQSSTAHTVRDSKSDIKKITSMLLEKEITTAKSNRTTPSFVDPTKAGMATLTKADWLQKQLAGKYEDHLQEEQSHDEVDMDYELTDTD